MKPLGPPLTMYAGKLRAPRSLSALLSRWRWLFGRIDAILSAKTDDLRELARIAGHDPATFYAHTHFTKADLAGQNTEGMLYLCDLQPDPDKETSK